MTKRFSVFELVLVVLLLAGFGSWAFEAGRSRSASLGAAIFEEGVSRAFAQEIPVGAQLVTTAGVVSSNGATAVPLLAIPGGYTAPPTHRFYVGGMTVYNLDAQVHTAQLVSHHSLRVIWSAPLTAGSGVILDSVNQLFSDQGTTSAAEGIDLVTDAGAGHMVGATGQGYYR